ncbi:MarR family transcriptional regulator [Streptomyces sp. NPDC095613]|uniref:MarR family winged helix-turn-helix transcriptional regulator n=1 Tax=Streptomyces sp. NPDC095613 TaxID=3155540 RepID=UPI00332B71E6
MAAQSQYAELSRQLSAVGVVKRGLARTLPAECPGGSAAVLSLLEQHGEMRMSRLAELLAVDMSVTSRHVAHTADRGWIERLPDPSDKRSRILRITPAGRDLLGELARRTTDMFAARLADWTDEEVGQLSSLLGRLRTDFGDCRDRHYENQSRQEEQETQGPRPPHGGRGHADVSYTRTPTR